MRVNGSTFFDHIPQMLACCNDLGQAGSEGEAFASNTLVEYVMC
jgi:hypothetical protein